jgi:hypothetical protein
MKLAMIYTDSEHLRGQSDPTKIYWESKRGTYNRRWGAGDKIEKRTP